MLEDKKAKFRKIAKKRVEKFAKRGKIKRDRYVQKHLKKIILENNFKNILFYIPLKNEVNLMPLINTLRGMLNVYVPFMVGKSFKMVKFRLPLSRKKFGIFEPKNSYKKIKKIDMAVVPVLGVDGTFGRIGFGKGMYDRFFESLKCSPIVVFVQLEECMVKENLCQSHDIRADIYITPYKIFQKKGRNVYRYKCCSSISNSRSCRIHNSKKIGCGKL